MTAEYNRIAESAQQERQRDMDWVRENAGIFQLAATLAFEESGRDAIVVDTAVQPAPNAGHRFGFFAQDAVEEEFDDNAGQMVQEYAPAEEVVLVLLRDEARTSTYRFRLATRSDAPGANQAHYTSSLRPSPRCAPSS